MDNITLTDQILIRKKPVDVKTTPLNSLSELNTTSIPRAWRYQGMEITVLNSDTTGIATRFILHKGTGDNAWKIKDKLTVNKFSDIEPFKPYLLDGTDVVVLTDETKNGEMTHYTTKTVQNDTESVLDFEQKLTSIKIIGDDF